MEAGVEAVQRPARACAGAPGSSRSAPSASSTAGIAAVRHRLGIVGGSASKVLGAVDAG
jgi:hypothetical protein